MKKNYPSLLLLLLTSSFLFAQYPPNTVWDPQEPDPLPLPNYLETISDTSKDIDIIRISDTTAFGYPAGSGELLHGYSKTQSWNSDMSKVFLGFTFVLNASDYTIDKQINFPGGYFTDGRWANTNPKYDIFVGKNHFIK